MANNLTVTFFVNPGDPAFICAVHGHCTLDGLTEIEDEFNGEQVECSAAGNYTFSCDYFPGQYGEYGMCELAPGWELTLKNFAPVEGNNDDE